VKIGDKITVTEEHLDRAIAEMPDHIDATKCCILAQAIKPFGGVEPGYNVFRVGDASIKVSGSHKMVQLFDEEEYGQIREMLPIELEVIDVVVPGQLGPS